MNSAHETSYVGVKKYTPPFVIRQNWYPSCPTVCLFRYPRAAETLDRNPSHEISATIFSSILDLKHIFL